MGQRSTELAAGLAMMLWMAPAFAADTANGESLFKRQCGICHSAAEGKTLAGPTLFGLIGRVAGTVPGFRYSAANRDAGFTWDTARLDPYLANPKDVVPGTTMMFGGMKDAEQRADLIAYLATLK